MNKFFALIFVLPLAGCSTIAHELQPHRLWRWNYQEAPGRTDDALFSIDDPLIPPMSDDGRELNTADAEDVRYE